MVDTVTIPEEVQAPEQVPQQQDPPSKKLYDGLIEEKLYTKSYDEFRKQYNTPESLKKLHDGLVEEKLYTKGDDDFINQYFPELKKKEEPIPSPSKSLDGNLPSVAPNTEIQAQADNQIDITDPILASQRYTELANANKDEYAAGGELGTNLIQVPDEEKRTQAKSLKNHLKEYGINDPENLAEEQKGLTENDYGRQGFDKETLLQDRNQNNELYQRKIANLKWRKGIEETLSNSFVEGGISKDEYDGLNHAIQSSLNNASVGDYNQQRGNINTVAKIIQNYGGVNKDELLKNYAVEVGKVYGNSYVNGFDKTATNQPESKYLDNNELLGYNYLHDIDPEKSAQYDRAFVDPKTLKDQPDALKGQQHLKQVLAETGIGLQLNAVNEEMKSIENSGNGVTFNSKEQQAKYEELQAKKNELIKASDDLDNKYPERLQGKVEDAMQEILGAKMGWMSYAGGMTGKAFKNTGQGIWEAVSEPFMSDSSNQIRELSLMGESLEDAKIYHKTDGQKGILTDKLVIKPELQSQIDAIANDGNLTRQQKEEKLYPLLYENKDKFGRVPMNGTKFNINPTSILYGVTDIASTLAPFIALEAVTGGGATAGAGRKFLSAFTAAAATGFHDAYADAVMNGKSQSDAYKEALGITAINSAALAGAGTPTAIKGMLGTATSAGKVVNSMTDGAINKIISNTPKGFNKLIDLMKSRAAATPKMITEGLKGGAKLEVANTIGNELKHQIFGTPIDREQNFKQSVLGMLNFGILGAGLGHIGYKSPTELQKSSFMEAGKNPDEYIAQAKTMVKDGNLSQSEFEQVKTNIENSAEAYKNLPTTNAKGKPLTEKQKGDILYNEAVKNEATKKAMTITQKEKAAHISLVSDYKNDLVVENPTDAQLESRKKTLEKSLEPKVDKDGKDIGLNDTEKEKVKANLEAVNDTIDTRLKEPKQTEPDKSSIVVQPPQSFTEPITVGGETKIEPPTTKDVSISGEKVWEEVKKAGSENNDDIQDVEEIIKRKDYQLAKVPINKLIENDPDLKEYLDTEKPVKSGREVTQPIVVADVSRGGDINKDGVVDGFHRIAQAIANGKTEIDAYVQTGSELLKKPPNEKQTTQDTKQAGTESKTVEGTDKTIGQTETGTGSKEPKPEINLNFHEDKSVLDTKLGGTEEVSNKKGTATTTRDITFRTEQGKIKRESTFLKALLDCL